jgi:hypothetical protein
MRIDVSLLRKQIEFLDTYPWREEHVPEEVEGVLHLLDAVLDEEDEEDLDRCRLGCVCSDEEKEKEVN